MIRRLLAAAVLACAVGIAPDARADLPPPDGTKFVEYSFSVENLDAFKDFVVVAYPCSGSYGVPSRDFIALEAKKPVAVGRRGGQCKLFAVARADLDAFTKTYKRTGSWEDKPLEAFFEGPKVHACDGGPTPSFTLPNGDPRSALQETLKATQVDAKSCVIASVTAPAPAPTATSAVPTASPSAAPVPSEAPSSAPATAPPPDAVPPGGRGCGGCAISRSEAGVSAFLAVGLAALFSSRRRGRTPRE